MLAKRSLNFLCYLGLFKGYRLKNNYFSLNLFLGKALLCYCKSQCSPFLPRDPRRTFPTTNRCKSQCSPFLSLDPRGAFPPLKTQETLYWTPALTQKNWFYKIRVLFCSLGPCMGPKFSLKICDTSTASSFLCLIEFGPL